jgi:hypothetical protein
MIKLGLGKIVPHRPDPSPVDLQALLETVAWCLSRPPQCDQLRSRELDPSAILRVPPLDEAGVGAWSKIKRESHQRAVQAINGMRSTLVRGMKIEIAGIGEAQSKGKLLLYEPLETVTDGASESCSHGFFDLEDAPPWDTWFRYSGGTIFSWVPESRLRNAQSGIDANIVDCIHWCNWSEL